MARTRSSSKHSHKKHKKHHKKSKKHKKSKHSSSSHPQRSFHYQNTETDRIRTTMKASLPSHHIRRRGLEYGRKHIYKNLKTEAFTRSLKYLNASAGATYLRPGGSATFEVTTGQNEWIRFLNQPIMLHYKIRTTNPDYNAASADAKTKSPTLALNKTDHPGAMMNPACGASCLIDRASLGINGKLLTDFVQLGSHSHLWKVINNRLATSKQRILDNCPYLQNDAHDRTGPKTLVPAWAGPPEGAAVVAANVPSAYSAVFGDTTKAFDAAQRPCYHKSWDDKDDIVETVSLDGFPFLSRPRSHCLSTLNETSDLNNQLFIPPQQNLFFSIQFRTRPHFMIDWTGQMDAVYFTSDNPAADLTKDVEIEITKVVLVYESFIPKSEKMTKEISTRRLSMHFDHPACNTYLLQDGAQHLETNLFIPGGTKAIVMGFMYGFQLWPFTGSHRGMRSDFVFPTVIKDLSIYHPDKGPLIASTLGDIGGKSSFRNVALMNYFSDLRDSGVINDSIETFLADSEVQKKYSQFFFVDLRAYKIKASVTLKVTTSCSGEHPMEKNMYLVLFTIGETALVKSGQDWSLHTVIEM